MRITNSVMSANRVDLGFPEIPKDGTLTLTLRFKKLPKKINVPDGFTKVRGDSRSLERIYEKDAGPFEPVAYSITWDGDPQFVWASIERA